MSLSHQDAVQGRGIGAEGMVRREVGGDARSASGASRAGAMPKVRPGRAGPDLDVRGRAGPGGVAHSSGTGWRRIGGIMRKTPRRSTLLKLSHVQSGPLCTWEPLH